MNAPRRTTGWMLALCGLALVLPMTALASPAKAKPPVKGPHGQSGSARGIVQSATPRNVVVRELDGTTVRIPVARSTHVFLDGKRASLGDARAGLVAIASWKGGKPALRLQLFDASATVAVVDSTAPGGVVVTMPSGANATIRANVRTRVLVDGRPSQLHAVKPGFLLVLKSGAPTGRPAAELRFLRPG